SRADPEFSDALQPAQIIEQRQQHHPNDQTDAYLHAPGLDSLRQRFAPYPFAQVEQEVTAVQNRDRQQVENAQANAQISEKIEEVRYPGLGRSAGHFSNRYRPTQVFYRELTEEHFLQ